MPKFCEHCGSGTVKLLSVQHCADKLDTSADFIRAHISKGTIEAIMLKGAKGSRVSIRIAAAELEKLIEWKGIREALSDST